MAREFSAVLRLTKPQATGFITIPGVQETAGWQGPALLFPNWGGTEGARGVNASLIGEPLSSSGSVPDLGLRYLRYSLGSHNMRGL